MDVDTSTTYVGVRKRKWGKWVSEIREPGKKTRIWLGSFETPEMAAVAHDVAAFWLKGQDARLNFPDSTDQFPRPLSFAPNHIRLAALQAALEVKFKQNSTPVGSGSPALQKVGSGSGTGLSLNLNSNFNLCGDEWGLDSPKLWSELAEAMLISPPQLGSCEMNYEVDQFQEQGYSLWEL